MLLRLHKVISTTSSHQPAHASAMPLSSGGRTGHRGASRDTRRAERRPHLRSDSLGGELDGAAHAHTGSRRCEHPAARANPAPAAGRTLLTLAVPQAGEATPTNRAFFASAADSSAEPLPALRQPLCSGTHFFFFPSQFPTLPPLHRETLNLRQQTKKRRKWVSGEATRVLVAGQHLPTQPR